MAAKRSSLVTIGLGEGEGVWQMANFPDRAVRQQNLDDVKTDLYPGMLQKP